MLPDGFQRVAFLQCVDFGGFSVMRKLGSSVVSSLGGRYLHRNFNPKLTS